MDKVLRILLHSNIYYFYNKHVWFIRAIYSSNLSWSYRGKSGKHDYTKLEWYLPEHFFQTNPSCNDVLVFLRLRRKYYDCERNRSYSMTRNSHIVRYEFLLVACPLPPLRWILNPRNNCRRYTPVENKLNVEFSRFTSASFSRAAGRHRFLLLHLLLLGFASISNANSRRSREERTPNNREGRREGKINQDIKEEPATTTTSSSTSLDILINAIMESRWTNSE